MDPNDPPKNDPPKNDPPVNDPPQGKVMTQAEIDKIVEGRLAKTKGELIKLQTTVEEFSRNKAVTEEQKKQLEEQLSSMQLAIMSKEELSAKEKKELEGKLENALKQSQEDVNRWKSLYERSTIEHDILQSVSTGDTKAFNPALFVSLLGRDSRLVEEVKDGKPTGRFVSMTKFQGQDKDGNTVPMELPTGEAIKEMRKLPKLYGTLFESGLTEGLGGNNTPGSGDGQVPVEFGSLDDYKKHREKVKA